MISFFVCLAILIGGYFIYGGFVSKVFGPDDRVTPAVSMEDGVDYVVMPTWRIFLIQLLNIAGLGPIWGAIGGAMWGPSVFLWITFGTILAGGVHDFASGFMSMRHEGLSVPELTGMYMGNGMKQVMRVFSTVLLFMLGVIACPISSGDTAFRSARLTLADALHLDQKSYKNRLILTLPLLLLGVLVSQLDYTSIWNYFASTNQILAAIVLWTAAMYLKKEGKNPYIAALPAAFMTAVTVSFVFGSKLYLGGIPFLPPLSSYLGVGIAVVLLLLFILKAPKAQGKLK